jgi:hypothetical protein
MATHSHVRTYVEVATLALGFSHRRQARHTFTYVQGEQIGAMYVLGDCFLLAVY